MAKIVQGIESKRVMLYLPGEGYIILRPGKARFRRAANKVGEFQRQDGPLGTISFDEAELTDEEMAIVAAHILVNGD